MDDKLLDRFTSLHALFDEVKKQVGWGDNIHISKSLLRVTVISYFKDIDRFKDYHNSLFADKHKKAAFTMKWLSRIRPVSYRKDDSDLSKKEITANSIFAVMAGLCFIDDIKIPDLQKGFMSNLIYTCQYRAIDELQMATSM